MGDIRLLVFNNGMQLLGEYLRADVQENKVYMSKPVQVIMVPKQNGPEGSVGIAFAPFMQYTEEWSVGVPFSPLDVLTVLTPERDLVNHYNTSYGTGLVLPQGVR